MPKTSKVQKFQIVKTVKLSKYQEIKLKYSKTQNVKKSNSPNDQMFKSLIHKKQENPKVKM